MEGRKTFECSDEFTEEILEIMHKHENLFNKTPRIANHYQHKIEIESNKPFICKRYPIPYKYKEQVEKELEEMEKDGIIEKAVTNYISPLVIVKKSKWRYKTVS